MFFSSFLWFIACNMSMLFSHNWMTPFRVKRLEEYLLKCSWRVSGFSKPIFSTSTRKCVVYGFKPWRFHS